MNKRRRYLAKRRRASKIRIGPATYLYWREHPQQLMTEKVDRAIRLAFSQAIHLKEKTQ